MSVQTVTVVRGAVDKYGNPLPGTQRAVEQCVVAPMATASVGGVMGWSTTDYTLYPPPGADIRQGDQVRLADGTLWKVDGHPFAWANPFTGTAAGGEVHIVRVG